MDLHKAFGVPIPIIYSGVGGEYYFPSFPLPENGSLPFESGKFLSQPWKKEDPVMDRVKQQLRQEMEALQQIERLVNDTISELQSEREYLQEKQLKENGDMPGIFSQAQLQGSQQLSRKYTSIPAQTSSSVRANTTKSLNVSRSQNRPALTSIRPAAVHLAGKPIDRMNSMPQAITNPNLPRRKRKIAKRNYKNDEGEDEDDEIHEDNEGDDGANEEGDEEEDDIQIQFLNEVQAQIQESGGRDQTSVITEKPSTTLEVTGMGVSKELDLDITEDVDAVNQMRKFLTDAYGTDFENQ